MTIESRDNYYNPLVLWVYDFFVQVLTNTFWWRCSTRSILVPFFIANTSARHLEVGAGTGYFLRQKVDDEQRRTSSTVSTTNWPEKLTLVDFHSQCMRKAASRIAHDISREPECVVANILEPLPLKRGEQFDSIALMYVLHCIPVPPAVKGRVVENLKEFLADDGVFFGSTVLGKGVRHNLIGMFLMWLYNYIGMFGNWDDGREEILKPIRENFEEVESEVVGTVLMWRAMKPRRW
nr:AstB [Aspergillus stellatus]